MGKDGPGRGNGSPGTGSVGPGRGSDNPATDKRHPEAKKSLGQNFLVSSGTVDAIIEAIGVREGPRGSKDELSSGDLSGRNISDGEVSAGGRPGRDLPVLEIGPGTGALTIPLAEKGTRVAAFEIDQALAESLRTGCAAYEGIEIVEADVRDLDFDLEGSKRGWQRFVIAGNIPYLLTSTILIKVGMARRCSRAVIMMPKEVGERIVALPGTRSCGILSVFMQAWFCIQRVVTVKASAFRPRPKIDSVVLAFDPVERTGAPEARREFFDFVKTGFSQRRKKLINVLADLPAGDAGAGPLGKVESRKLAEIAKVDIERRPEELHLEEWFSLFDAFAGGT